MSVIKNVSYFLVAIVLSRAVGFVQSFILARCLGPENFGVWVTLLLVVSYAPIFALGTGETMLKRVPYFLGRNDMAGVREIENSVLGSLVLSSILLAALAMFAPFILPFTSWHVRPFMVVMVLVTVAISYFSNFFYIRCSAYEDFKMTGRMDLCRAVLALCFVGGMGFLWGLTGVVAGYMLHEICMLFITAYCNMAAHGRPGVSFHRDSIIGAIRVGLPITLLWWVLTLTNSVDRLVLSGMLGAVAVGYYALGISLSGVLFLVPTVVGRVLYPKVNKHFGQNADAESMKRVVLAPTLALGTLLVNFQICILAGTPLLYNQLLPKYHPGLLAGQILILGSFFVCLFRNGANYLIAANQERVFLKYIIATLVFNVLFDVGLVRAGFGTEGVALGTSLAGLFLTTLVWRRVLMGLGFEPRQQWATVFDLYLPSTVLLSVFGCLRLLHWASFQTFNVASVLMGLLLLVAVNGILWCFPVYRAEMQVWRNTLRRKKQSLAPSPQAVDSVY
jgi:O-antigen/teichoic acid export membrane protein